MKKYNFLFILFAVFALLFAAGCKENSVKSSEILRKIRLKNNPDDIAADLITALQKGKAKQIYTLSSDRIQNIMENSALFANEEMEFNDILKHWEEYLKKQYSSYLLTVKLLKKEKKSCIYQLYMQTPGTEECKIMQITLQMDEHKNWKNDTRF